MSNSIDSSFQNAIPGSFTATAQSLDITSSNGSTQLIQVSGTWTGSLLVQGSNDDINFFTVFALNEVDKKLSTSITVNGAYSANTTGFQYFRLRSNGTWTGTANVIVYGSDSSSLIQTQSVLRDVLGNPIGSTNNRLNVDVKISKDNGQVDTTSRIRTVLPVELFSYYFSNTAHPLRFNTTNFNGGTGTTSLILTKAAVDVTNSLGSNHKINFTTKKYVRYSPGQTHRMTIAARIGSPAAGVEKRWGMFTEFNGFYFRQTSTGLAVVVRRGGAGDPVTETVITQANFNRDKVDGTGTSGLNLNTDTHGIYFIEWDWHGAGVIKFGIIYRHEPLYLHEFEFDFAQADTSTRSPGLPINVEVKNTSTQTVAPFIRYSACSIYRDGFGSLQPEYSFVASRGVNSRTVSNAALSPLISIRPKLLFNGVLARISLVPKNLQVQTSDNDLYIQVTLNSTLTGATFASVDNNSNAEFDIAATALTGGFIIWEGYLSPNQGSIFADLEKWELNVSYDLLTADILTVSARSLGNNNATRASIKWDEFQ